MTPTIGVKPVRPDTCPAHPLAGRLPPEGAQWPADQFTFRRLRDGDVVRLDESDAGQPSAESPKTQAVKAPAAKSSGQRRE